jgi:formate C-acetyltransferase
MIRTFIERGGIEMQINSIDRETLEDALVHPENHKDLLIRIGGYSDYFVRLTPETQKEVISRTEY